MPYAMANLSSQVVAPTNPWEFKPDVPKHVTKSKAEFVSWCQHPQTKHCHFSMAEGLDPLRRVGGDNPATMALGLIGDFDAPCTSSMIVDTVKNSPTEFAPNWGSLTFSSGGRLVWRFQEPVPLPNLEVAKTFYKLCARKLRITKYLPGFDADAFSDPSRYYERGRDWALLSNDPIPSTMVWQWLYEAGNKRKWKDSDHIAVPMDKIADEVQKRYPGVWRGPFEDGARGARFWDESADNATAAVIRASGMQCFTGDRGFVPWEEILGSSFVRKYEADTTGEIIKSFYFDTKNYWRQEMHGMWVPVSKDDTRLALKVKYGLSAYPGKKESSSEVDRVVYAIQEQKMVAAAMPFIHQPEGLLVNGGKRFLNTSAVKCIEPTEADVDEWGDGFPWLAEFLTGFFEPEETLDYFLGWLQHFYINGLAQTPRTGHALFIAGDTNMGKTFLSTGIVSRMVGGHMDASNYLLGEGNFTSHVVGAPMMTVDDTQGASDQRRRTRYSAAIKKVVANRHQLFEEKFLKAGLVEWLGRVVVTLNLDPESSLLLPNCDISIMDKIMLLRCARRKFEFPPPDDIERVLQTELPAFCRWITQWEIPDHVKGDVRFGVKPYHDKHMYSSAIQTSSSYSFFELLADFLGGYESEDGYYTGTSTQLIADMSLDERIGSLAMKYSPAQAASLLGQLKARGFEFERVRSSSQRIWKIPLNIVERLEKENDAKDKN